MYKILQKEYLTTFSLSSSYHKFFALYEEISKKYEGYFTREAPKSLLFTC